MKRGMVLAVVAAFVLAVPVAQFVWGKAHVPTKKVQVCHKGKTITVSQNALTAHVRHGDCQLPACDFNNVFFTGDTCDFDRDPAGLCAGLPNARDSAEGIKDACPLGTF